MTRIETPIKVIRLNISNYLSSHYQQIQSPSQMPLLEEVVTRCTEIEHLLRLLGAKGSGISELIESIERDLDSLTVNRIRNFAAIRNRFVHEHEYEYPDSQAELLSSADELLTTLKSRASLASSTTNIGQLNSKSLFSPPKGKPMGTTYPWVQLITEKTQPRLWLLRFNCIKDRRLVFFKGPVPEVLSLGKHKVPFFGVSTIAYVSMAPAVITLELALTTQDRIELNAVIDLNANVRDSAEAIARIALDAQLGTNEEIRLLEALFARHLQQILASITLDNLPDTKILQQELTALLQDNRELSLQVASITIRSFGPSDKALQNHNLDRLHIKNDAALKAEQELAAKSQREIESQLYEEQRKRQREALDWDREHSKNIAKDQSEIELQRHNFELEKLRIEMATKIQLAQIQKDTEVAKAARIALDQMMPMIIKGAIGEGERQILASIVRKQIGISVGLTSFESQPDQQPQPPTSPSAQEPEDDSKI